MTAGMGCGCGVRGLEYRTPSGYIAAARRLGSPNSSPVARRAWQKAAIAYATSEAARQGRRDLVAKGLGVLKSLGDEPTPVLTREQIQAKFAELAQQQVERNMEGLRVAASIISAAIGFASVAGTAAIANPQDRATYAAVLQTIQFAISRATGGTTATLPTLSEDAIRGLAGFCGVWSAVAPSLPSAIEGLAAGTALGDRSAAAAIGTIGRIVVGVGNGICSELGRQVTPPTTTTAPGATNCMDPCPSGQIRQTRTDGNGCDCVVPTGPSPADRARYAHRIAVTGRGLYEAVLTRDPDRMANTTSAQRAAGLPNQMPWRNFNCAYACTLEWAERQVLALTGSIPATGGQPASTTPRRFFNPATNPGSCDCRTTTRIGPGVWIPNEPDSGGGAGGGGGAGVVIAAGAAAVAAYFLFR